MPRIGVTLANKKALELYETNTKCANNHSETQETAPESTTAATSTTEDTIRTNGSPTANVPIGSWAGWAELENDPVILSTVCVRDIG